jgi:hypothetical protein
MAAPLPAPIEDDELADDRPDTVVLGHNIFKRFTDIYFRRAAGDGTPVMIVQLTDAPAALPIRALQREFGIADDSPDGLVLGMIGEALDFVGVLRPGDAFPPEVLSGSASWQPEPRHFELALARLRNGLVAWLPGGDGSVTEGAAFRDRLTEAFRAAARELGLPRPEDAVALVEELAGELAHIEYLREHLIVGMIRMQAVLAAIAPQMRADRNRSETVMQIIRLLNVAVERTRARFNEIDEQTGQVMEALRSLPAQRAMIRSTRDYLHRSWRAFEPILSRWTAIDPANPMGLRGAIEEAYAFLAPRYMNVQDWIDGGRRMGVPEKKQKNQMEW